jgi:hypothetical protein
MKRYIITFKRPNSAEDIHSESRRTWIWHCRAVYWHGFDIAVLLYWTSYLTTQSCEFLNCKNGGYNIHHLQRLERLNGMVESSKRELKTEWLLLRGIIITLELSKTETSLCLIILPFYLLNLHRQKFISSPSFGNRS